MTDSAETNVQSSYGVHSEVGRLRKVLVCAPGLAHRRLTPSNNDDLLFDDVMWVENAQRDHADFVNKMTQRGVDVVELHQLLAETMEIPGARDWLLGAKIEPNRVGLGLVDGTRAYLESVTSKQLAEYLIGGLATTDLPDDFRSGYISLARESAGAREYLMPPLPNTLYTRDTTCWLYGGLTMNPLYWPARQDETLIYKAIYEFHPDYVGSKIWWGDPERDWAQATFEGGDIMPVGNGVVLMGMSERTSRQAITQVAAALFAEGAAERVVIAGMPKLACRDAPRHRLHLRRPRHRHPLPDDHERRPHVCAGALRQGARCRGHRRGIHTVRRRGPCWVENTQDRGARCTDVTANAPREQAPARGYAIEEQHGLSMDSAVPRVGTLVLSADLQRQAATLMSTIAPPPSDMVLRLAMLNSWGFPASQAVAGTYMNIVTFYSTRFLVPSLGLALLLATPSAPYAPAYGWIAAGSAVVAALLIGSLLGALRRDEFASWIAGRAGRMASRLRS